MPRLLALLRAKCDPVLLLYMLASVLALAVDVSSFLVLIAIGVSATAASAIGYSFGILTHWLISSRKVFDGRVAASGIERTRQKTLFVASALIGFGLTTAIVAAAGVAGVDPRLAKALAIGVSFFATWLIRNRVVFRADAAMAGGR